MNTWLLLQGFASPFSLVITLSCVWGLGLLVWKVPDRKQFHLWGGVVILLCILLGARLDYVFLHRGYYFSHVVEIPQVWLGGLGPVGGVGGGVIGLVLVSLIGKRALRKLVDAGLPLLGALALGLGLASLFGGLGYGPRTEAWWGVVMQDEFGVLRSRWPIHLLGGVVSGIVPFALAFLPQGQGWLSRPGRRGGVGLLAFALAQGGVSTLRVDPGFFVVGLRWQTWAAVLLTILALILLILPMRCRNDDRPSP